MLRVANDKASIFHFTLNQHKFNVVAAIPADATGILAFYKDIVWDGDTWWYPVEWQDVRGYVSGNYLPHYQ